jgi:hypothetical protein
MRKKDKTMRRALPVLIALFLLLLAGTAPEARPSAAQEAPPAARPPDPLEEFVPHERLPADSIVAFPVDI